MDHDLVGRKSYASLYSTSLRMCTQVLVLAYSLIPRSWHSPAICTHSTSSSSIVTFDGSFFFLSVSIILPAR